MRTAHLEALIALVLLGCAGSPAPSGSSTGAGTGGGESPPWPLADAADPPVDAPLAVWTSLGLVAVGPKGATGPATANVPTGSRYLGLRAAPETPVHDDALCFRFEDVGNAAGETWVLPRDAWPDAVLCAACPAPAMATPDLALAVLPNDGAPFGDPGDVHFQVGFADCRTGFPLSAAARPNMPAALQLAMTTAPETAGPRTLELRIAVAPGVPLAQADGGPALFAQARARLGEALGQAGLELRVTRLARLSADPPSPLFIVPGALDPVRALVSEARALLGDDEGYVPVVVARCLEVDDPLTKSGLSVRGYTPRIPGGAGPASTVDAVLLAGACNDEDTPTDPLDGVRLGNLLAHELGHHLGLFHSNAPAGAPLAVPGELDLMASTVGSSSSTTLRFTKAQSEVLRRHPLAR